MRSPRNLFATALLSIILGCSAFSNVPYRSSFRVETKNIAIARLSSLPQLTSTHLTESFNDETNQIETKTESEEGDTEQGFAAKLKRRIAGKKFSRASLAKLGTSVLLSYGFVSNAFGVTCVSVAWFLSSQRTGLSPLSPGQWKGFMAIYAAFFAFLNIIRPARFALSVALSKYFDRALSGIQNRFNCSKAVAVGLLLSINICFGFAFMAFGVATASTLSGVPVWAGRV